MKRENFKKYLKYIAGLLWLLIIAAFLFSLLKYQYQTNAKSSLNQANSPMYTNLENTFNLDSDTNKLFVFLHSECVCSEASLDELAKIFANLNKYPDLYFIFSQPEGFKPDIKKSKLWDQAIKFAAKEYYIDLDAKLVKDLSLISSGTVLYFAKDQLLYLGGITGSRAHRGDNLGARKLLQLMQDKTNMGSEFPVFGCALY